MQHYISTGHLPSPARVRTLVGEAFDEFGAVVDGDVSNVYPALAEVSPDRFGICVVGVDGSSFAAGDSEVEFPIMSISKPLVFALVCSTIGAEEVRQAVGVNATGLAFNSLDAVERGDGRTNPMVNSGAIATTSLVPGADADERWQFVIDGLSRFAGRTLALDSSVYRSASETNLVNHEIVQLLATRERITGDPTVALDLYTRQCALRVTARDLAVMGATLADGGVNPLTSERVVDDETCRYTLAVMTTAGLYETSGDWLYDIGLPGKSGIGGGIVTVSPGKGGLGTFSPRLDGAGNSVRGQLAAHYLSRALGLDLFASEPATRRASARTPRMER